MCLNVFYSCLFYLTVSPVPWSFFISLTVSIGVWVSLTVSTSAMKLLHVFHCLIWLMAVSQCLSRPLELLYFSFSSTWLLAVSHCLSGPMELLHISHCLLLLLAVSYCLSQCHGVAACLLLSPIIATHVFQSPMVDDCLSISLPSFGVAIFLF